MRILMTAIAAMLLSLPATAPASACGAGAKSAQTVATTFSADEKKPAKKKPMKKAAKKKMEKVEYMRAVPVK